MSVTWAKAGAVLAVIAPSVGGAWWMSNLDTKVQVHEAQIDKLLVVPETVGRIDERTIAMQKTIDRIESQLSKE